MKKILLPLMALSLLFAGCERTADVELPLVSFEAAVPVISDGVASLKVISDYNAGTPVEIPVSFGGEAILGIDYEISADTYVIGGENPVTEIKVTPLIYGTRKKVSVTLVPPGGIALGRYPSMQFSISDRLGYLSFVSEHALLTEHAEVEVGIFDGEGNSRKMDSSTFIPVEVDTENSTAVEGTHFRFEGEPGAMVEAGESEGAVRIVFLKNEEGMDKIVLKLKDSPKFSMGQYLDTEITVLGSYWNSLDGEWVMNEIITTKDFLEQQWFGMVTYDGLPEFNPEDRMTFDLENALFLPEFKSTYKHYFLGESHLQKKEEMILSTDTSGSKVKLQLFELDNVNRFFSSKEVSQDKKALAGVRIFKDEKGQELLDLYIIDHTSKSFMPEILASDMYDKVKPVATSTGCFLNATFRKNK